MTKTLGILLVFAPFALPQAGMREVVYEVDGTAKYANVTLTNKDGGKEQNQVKLPFEMRFYARIGQFLYLSAQKARVMGKTHTSAGDQSFVLDDGIAGNVHVLIRTTGSVLQEASSDAPYGIATAEGKLPE